MPRCPMPGATRVVDRQMQQRREHAERDRARSTAAGTNASRRTPRRARRRRSCQLVPEEPKPNSVARCSARRTSARDHTVRQRHGAEPREPHHGREHVDARGRQRAATNAAIVSARRHTTARTCAAAARDGRTHRCRPRWSARSARARRSRGVPAARGRAGTREDASR